MKKCSIQAPARAHQTIRKLLVHPKDKVEDPDKCGVVYHNVRVAPKCTSGKTRKKLSIRENDLRKETEKGTAKRKTQSTTKNEDTNEFKSAISEHCRKHNHIMNWNSLKVMDREYNKFWR